MSQVMSVLQKNGCGSRLRSRSGQRYRVCPTSYLTPLSFACVCESCYASFTDDERLLARLPLIRLRNSSCTYDTASDRLSRVREIHFRRAPARASQSQVAEAASASPLQAGGLTAASRDDGLFTSGTEIATPARHP